MLDLSREFISHPIKEIDQVITDSLKMIGKFLTQNANQGFILTPERISLRFFSADHSQLLNSHSWKSEDAPSSSKKRIPQSVMAKEIPHILDQFLGRLKLNEVVYIENLTALPKKVKKELRNSMGLMQESLILLPLIHIISKKEVLQGFISIGFIEQDAVHTEDAYEMLMHFSSLISAALKRLKLEMEVDIFEYFRSLR